MKKVKRRLTINQSEYMKELNRIKRFIKNAEKKGYNFGNYNPPKMPKRVTKKSIQTLRNIKPKDLYAKATYYDVITDSVISGTEAHKKLIKHKNKKCCNYSPPTTEPARVKSKLERHLPFALISCSCTTK